MQLRHLLGRCFYRRNGGAVGCKEPDRRALLNVEKTLRIASFKIAKSVSMNKFGWHSESINLAHGEEL